MKTVTFVDGTTLNALDDSNVAQIRIPVESFGDVDTLKETFTKANMETLTIGAEEFHQVNPISVSANTIDGQIIATFYNQDGLQDYVQNQIDNYTEWLIDEGVI